ncbi:MAG: hypothetical protein AMXMBFR84_38930 [Candidatus Hydrogenedentota bacterium]
MPVLNRVTSPYSKVEGWIYDRVIAPAIMELGSAIDEHLVRHIPSDAELLDVGCGGGHMAIHFADALNGVKITGLDLSPDQVARATRRAAPYGDRVQFVQGSALEIPFEDERFDAVVSIASIKHWPDQAKGVSECIRVLKPGGRLAIVEADRGCRLEDARSFVKHWRIPGILKPVFLPVFRTFVAGQSLDLVDAMALFAGLDVDNSDAHRIPGTPGLIMLAHKADR